MKIYNPNNIIMAAPSQEEIIQGTRIVNVTVSNINVLKTHASFAQYFDFNQTCPCYNSTVAEFCIMWKIKNPLQAIQREAEMPRHNHLAEGRRPAVAGAA
ncbi:MAG: hypothetical protein Q8769_02735, partial [Candidatus Phytoplasma australasiaticum]|nr:hypothetical protein [Candidatus Phytoplasma australasiaticum]